MKVRTHCKIADSEEMFFIAYPTVVIINDSNGLSIAIGWLWCTASITFEP